MTGRRRDRGRKGRGPSKYAGWLAMCGFTVAVCALLAAIAAGLGSRLGIWHFRAGFDMLRWGAYGGITATLISLVAGFMALRQPNRRLWLLSLLGLIVGGVAAVVPVAWRMAAMKLPRIHDITTDINRPPQFVAILPLRKDAPNPAVYGGADVAVMQRKAYPDIKTVVLNVPINEAFRRALAASRSMGWKVVAADPAAGRIEATDTTFWFGFTDDIVVRVTGVDYRALVDIRSVSRVGVSDVGTNAKRIRAFVRRLSGG